MDLSAHESSLHEYSHGNNIQMVTGIAREIIHYSVVYLCFVALHCITETDRIYSPNMN